MKLTIEHETHYQYGTAVTRSTQYLRLTPRPSPLIKVHDWQLDLPGSVVPGIDAYGNVLHVMTLDQPHSSIRLVASGVVETRDDIGTPHEAGALPVALFLRPSDLTRVDAPLADFADGFAADVGAQCGAGLERLAQELRLRMPFTPGVTHSLTSASEAFSAGLGVCQDHSHVFLACARRLGVPARYVSGYLATDRSHVDSHAWVEVWRDDAWWGMDISNGCLTDGHYVRLAIGHDYQDACPVRGVRLGGGEEALSSQAIVSHDEQ
ncbi:transglutaminase family protein [Paludibacterium yongneupense]|uniref:transglutaminase family protein n=1 Tax=Paludibacterium yongneupense TaxID=400061 RepID=UPI000400922F|nr:transglutaminase family protein [Paludibacterium yongneupense]